MLITTNVNYKMLKIYLRKYHNLIRRAPLKLLCDNMKNQIISRAFYGCSYSLLIHFIVSQHHLFFIKRDLYILKCVSYLFNHTHILLSQGWRTAVTCPQYALTCLALLITLLWNQMCLVMRMVASRQKCGRSFFKTAA